MLLASGVNRCKVAMALQAGVGIGLEQLLFDLRQAGNKDQRGACPHRIIVECLMPIAMGMYAASNLFYLKVMFRSRSPVMHRSVVLADMKLFVAHSWYFGRVSNVRRG